MAAIQLLLEQAESARRVLACAGLCEVAGDAAAAAHRAEVALHMAGEDDIVRKGADAMLQRVRAIAAAKPDPSIPSKSAEQRVQASVHAMLVTPDDRADEVVVKLGPVFEGPDLSDVSAVRNYCRGVAEAWDGSLVEADVVQTPSGSAIQMIYKNRWDSDFSSPVFSSRRWPMRRASRPWLPASTLPPAFVKPSLRPI